MAIQVLKQEEINEVSGGAITVGGPGLALSLDPFALVGGLLTNTLALVTGAVAGVTGLVGGLLAVVTGLLGTVTSLV